jgi:bifunctional non-homologous end joining protein LigD
MEDTTTLYFRQGPSDKVYQAWIRPKDNGFMVHFAYGRRGSTLNTGSKTSAPVEYQIAKDIYENSFVKRCPRATSLARTHPN